MGQYTIKNVVRSVNTRTRRFALPQRPSWKQYVAGRRLLRNQVVNISEQEFEQCKDAILEAVKQGALLVTTPDGKTISVSPQGILQIRHGMSVEPYTPDSVQVTSAQDTVPSATTSSGLNFTTIDSSQVTVMGQKSEVGSSEDDLTQLLHIGPGRARSLQAQGIKTLKDVIDADPLRLAKILGKPVTKEQVEEIQNSARELVG